MKTCWCVSGISNAEARQPGKAPNFSVNWTVGDQALEVINATTGKDDMGRPSRLCKHALYSRWVRLHSKVQRHLNILKHCLQNTKKLRWITEGQLRKANNKVFNTNI